MTMLYPPERETIINNEPITAEEFLELYRPAREFTHNWILAHSQTDMSGEFAKETEAMTLGFCAVAWEYAHCFFEKISYSIDDCGGLGSKSLCQVLFPFWKWKKVLELVKVSYLPV